MSNLLSDAIVFFGASGDLAYKQIFPSLLRLVRDEGVRVPIIGVAKSGWSLENLKDRAKDIIIRHGENISPKEVEDILAHHPDVAEIAIVGLPDERTGERACAVIVPARSPGP